MGVEGFSVKSLCLGGSNRLEFHLGRLQSSQSGALTVVGSACKEFLPENPVRKYLAQPLDGGDTKSVNGRTENPSRGLCPYTENRVKSRVFLSPNLGFPVEFSCSSLMKTCVHYLEMLVTTFEKLLNELQTRL